MGGSERATASSRSAHEPTYESYMPVTFMTSSRGLRSIARRSGGGFLNGGPPPDSGPVTRALAMPRAGFEAAAGPGTGERFHFIVIQSVYGPQIWGATAVRGAGWNA